MNQNHLYHIKTGPNTGKGKKGSFLWPGVIVLLILVYTVGKPAGEKALEAVGLKDSQWTEMVNSINEVSNAYDGKVGIYIKNLKTNQVFERNADQRFITASLIKLPIMAAVFQAIRDERISLSSQIRLRSKHKRWGSGRLKWAKAGRKFRVSELLYKMITISDNTATEMLIDRFGYNYLNWCFKKYGFNVTRIDPVGMRLSDYVHPARDNYTTPKEMGRFLEKIYRRELINDGYSDLMIEIMKEAESKTRLRKYLPKEWSFAHKSGLLRKNCHDVGIVFTPKADYIICVLTRENETYNQAKTLIAQLGKTAYSFIGPS